MIHIYDLPKYYDIAFSWDLSGEIKFFQTLFKRYVPFSVQNILEPACGSGRFLVALPDYGYNITGYDLNPIMIDYAQERIRQMDLEPKAKALLGDMATFRTDSRFDVALNSINSIGYLLEEQEVMAHLGNTAECLNEGGIYIIHLGFANRKMSQEECDNWTFDREGITVNITWGCKSQDRENMRAYEYCSLHIDNNGKKIQVDEDHTLRLWHFEDFKRIIAKSGRFRLAGIYNQKYEEVDPINDISGEDGNHYFILKTIN